MGNIVAEIGTKFKVGVLSIHDSSFAGVRVAKPEDEQQIFNMLEKLHEENSLFKMNPAKVWQTIRRATQPDIRTGDVGIIGVIDGKSGIEASVGFFADAFWYTDEFMLSELWTYVLPDFRRSTHAKRLIEFGKWAALRLKVPYHTGTISNIRTEAKVRLYRRQLDYYGAFFFYNLKPSKANGHAREETGRENMKE